MIASIRTSNPFTRAALPALGRAPWIIVTDSRIIDTIGLEIIDLGKDQYTQTIIETSAGGK